MTKKSKKSVYTDNDVFVAELARRIGVTKQTAHQYKKDGRLVMTEDGKRAKYIESVARIKQTARMNGFANECHAAAEREEINNRIEQNKYDDLKSDVAKHQLDLSGTNAKELFDNSRALREKAAALQAAAEHEKFIGSLVSKEVVEKIMFERARSFRDSLLTSARRMSPLVAGKENISEIETLLTDEYKSLLVQFAKMPLVE